MSTHNIYFCGEIRKNIVAVLIGKFAFSDHIYTSNITNNTKHVVLLSYQYVCILLCLTVIYHHSGYLLHLSGVWLLNNDYLCLPHHRLNLKGLIMTAADDTLIYFFVFFRENNA